MGYPAFDYSVAKRSYTRLRHLPELFTRVREVEKALEKISSDSE